MTTWQTNPPIPPALREGINEARGIVAFFRPALQPVLLSEITWRATGWSGQLTKLEALIADILADGYVLKRSA